MVEDQPPGNAFAAWMLLTGPAIHLWFLPLAFAASLLMPGLMRISPQIRQGPMLVLCGGAARGTRALAQRATLPAICPGFGFALVAAACPDQLWRH